MAIKSYAQITSSIIDSILIVNNTIDVKIGSVVRDIVIDSQVPVFQDLYNLADFVSRSSSIYYAQNTQLDLLAQNANVVRTPAQYAYTTLQININSGLTAPTTFSIGDQFYTLPNSQNNTYGYINATTVLGLTGQTQVTLNIVAQQPGSSYNVPAYTITQSNYDFVDSVYNPYDVTTGQDEQTDSSLIQSIQLKYTGQYLNTFAGIQKAIFNTANIANAPVVITPENQLARGPYAVDVYLQRTPTYEGTAVTDNAPANFTNYTFSQQPLFELNPVNQVIITNPQTQKTQIIPEVLNGTTQYQVITCPTDPLNIYQGSIYAGWQLQWLVQPPSAPYQVSYNVDQTIIDAQSTYDSYNEVTANTLFKQAKSVPIWLSVNLTAINSANPVTLVQQANTNIYNLFSNVISTEKMTKNDVLFSLLGLSNVIDVSINNFDTTYEIVLDVGALNPNNNTVYALTLQGNNSGINPFGFYLEQDTGTQNPTWPFAIAARLFIGNPDFINPLGYNFTNPTNKTGVYDPNIINNLVASWPTSIDTYYDSTTQTLVFNFSNPPSGTNPTISMEVVQTTISLSSAAANTSVVYGDVNTPLGAPAPAVPVPSAYLSLAPSLVQTPILVPVTQGTSTPIYAVTMPDGLDPARAKLYKNGIPLTAGSSTTVADYVIAGPDVNGIYNIAFTVQPNSTDVLSFGLLSPDVNVILLSTT